MASDSLDLNGLVAPGLSGAAVLAAGGALGALYIAVGRHWERLSRRQEQVGAACVGD